MATTTAETLATQDKELVKGLGLTSATTLVMGSMIGSGIFIVSAQIARDVQSPGFLILTWFVTGFLTIVGALCYGELAAMMPRAGGQYVYLREAFGPLVGFLYGWTLFLVIQTGTIAAVGVAFGKFLGIFFPGISATNWIFHIRGNVGLNTQGLVGILVVVVLTAVNMFGVRTGDAVQNTFTFAQTAALLGLVLLGFAIGRNPEAIAHNFTNFWRNPGVAGSSFPWLQTAILIAISQVGSLFSSDGWNNVTFTAGEVKNPKRNLPLSLALGTGTVIALYIAANFIYLGVLPLDQIKTAAEDRVATAAMLRMFGAMGASLMAVAILISTFGCNNGLNLAGARVYYAMAKDGLFFKSVGKVHPKYKTPALSLIGQGVWTCLLCPSGPYGQLCDYII